jgi:hypothetical protein
MNMRLFFLKQDGWFEAELTEKLLHATGEDLIRWAYTMMKLHHYRNYWIREEPHPCLSAGRPCPLSGRRGEKTKEPAERMNSSFIIPNL